MKYSYLPVSVGDWFQNSMIPKSMETQVPYIKWQSNAYSRPSTSTDSQPQIKRLFRFKAGWVCGFKPCWYGRPTLLVPRHCCGEPLSLEACTENLVCALLIFFCALLYYFLLAFNCSTNYRFIYTQLSFRSSFLNLFYKNITRSSIKCLTKLKIVYLWNTHKLIHPRQC